MPSCSKVVDHTNKNAPYFHQLPIEILESIFDLIEPEDLPACAQVCKRWNYVLNQSKYAEKMPVTLKYRRTSNRRFPGLYDYIPMRLYFPYLTIDTHQMDDTMANFFDIIGTTVKEFIFTNALISPTNLKTVIDKMPNLHTLMLKAVYISAVDTPDDNVVMKKFPKIFDRFSHPLLDTVILQGVRTREKKIKKTPDGYMLTVYKYQQYDGTMTVPFLKKTLPFFTTQYKNR